jgi:hypothetical protein
LLSAQETSEEAAVLCIEFKKSKPRQRVALSRESAAPLSRL